MLRDLLLFGERLMADPTDEELLSAVKLALKGSLEMGARDMKIAGRSITTFSLAELILLRNDLERRIAIAAGRGQASVATFRQPS
jgi:hypothetical protein